MGQAVKLGFCLLLWDTFITDDHWPIVEKLKATGYDGVEVPLFTGEVADYEKLGKRLAAAGLEANTIGVLPRGSAISPDKSERDAALDSLKWFIDCTAALGAKVAAGPLYHPLGTFSGSGPSADEVARCADVHKAAAQYAARQGVAISVEPLNRFECYFLNTTAQAVELVKKVDEPNYGYLYDTFHFNIEEDSYVDVIPATIRQINHVQISENNRGVPGAGHIDFPAVFGALKKAGYNGWMTIESFGAAMPDLMAATKIWRPIFARAEDVYERGYRTMRDGWDKANS